MFSNNELYTTFCHASLDARYCYRILAVCLSVCHTGDTRLNGSIYGIQVVKSDDSSFQAKFRNTSFRGFNPDEEGALVKSDNVTDRPR